MKKILFEVLFLVAILVISGCKEDSSDDPQMRPPNIQNPGGGGGGSYVDDVPPEIQEFMIYQPDCETIDSNSDDMSCDVRYSVYATDNMGIVSYSRILDGPIGGNGGAGYFGPPGVRQFWLNGTYEDLGTPGLYTMTVTVRDFQGNNDTMTRTFTLPG